MFLEYKSLELELKQNGCSKFFFCYCDTRKKIKKIANNQLHIEFLENCIKSEIIPRLLKFRILESHLMIAQRVHETLSNVFLNFWYRNIFL